MTTFNVGDTVVLKSGGPTMTIDKFPWDGAKGVYHTDRVECVWFGNGELKRETFQVTSLDKD